MSEVNDPKVRQFCCQLRDERVAKGLSQRQLSDLAGIPHSLIGKYERGDGVPRPNTLLKLKNALAEVAVPQSQGPTIFGEIVSVDFDYDTVVLKMEPGYKVSAGRYALTLQPKVQR